MRKLLIVGASILQLPAIKKAKELGYYVGVIDYNPNAVGVQYADEYFNVSTIDTNGIVATAKGFHPDGIMTLATDMPVRSIAVACKELGLASISPEAAVMATDKGEMIKAFSQHGVEHPWYHIIFEEGELVRLEEQLSFPCIIKPIDNSGSRGVVLVNNKSELLVGYMYARKQSRSGAIIIEEYMHGSEVSVEIMVVDNEPNVLAVTDKLTTGAPNFVEMGHSQPSMLDDHDVLQIKDIACRSVKALGITCGPAHVEVMLTPNGPKLVELGARMGGDCITSHLVPLSTGIDMTEATIRMACGEKTDISRKFHKGSAIRYFNPPYGKIIGIRGVDKAQAIKGIKEVTFTKSIGDTVTAIHSSIDRIGYVVAQADTAKEAIEICQKALSVIQIESEVQS